MNTLRDKTKQYWLPFLILAIAILAISWFISGLIYPDNIQGSDLPIPLLQTATETFTITPSPSATPSPSDSGNVTGTPTLFPTTDRNCTYTIYFWQSNPDAWMIENIVIGSIAVSKAEAINILASDEDNETTGLLRQFFGALLNTLRGADATSIEKTLIQAGDWLSGNPPGVELTTKEKQEAIALTEILAQYNNGSIGPGHCPDELSTPTTLPTATFSPTETPTPTIERTYRFTPTSTRPSGRPTSIPTNPPTDTPQPKPTNTPKPTSTPRPTPTTAPTATSGPAAN